MSGWGNRNFKNLSSGDATAVIAIGADAGVRARPARRCPRRLGGSTRVGKPILDYRLKPLIERFGDRPVAEIKTADIDDFVADLKRPRVVNGLEGRRLTPASINRTLGLLRHMLTQ